MQTTYAKVESLAETVKDYVDMRIELVKLEAAEKSSEVIGNISARIIVLLLSLLVIIFLGIGLSLLIGDLLGKPWLGFMIVAGVFTLLSWVTWAARDKLFQVPVMNSMIEKMTGHHEED